MVRRCLLAFVMLCGALKGGSVGMAPILFPSSLTILRVRDNFIGVSSKIEFSQVEVKRIQKNPKEA